MNQNLRADLNLREIALSVARNEVGANEPLSVVLLAENLTQYEYDQIAKNPQFQRYLTEFKADLVENGFSFTAKSRILAEDLLQNIFLMAKDPDTPAAMRVRTLENLVEWGKLKPQGQIFDTGGGYSITINLPGAPNTLSAPRNPLIAEDVTPAVSITIPGNPGNHGKPSTLPSLITFDDADDLYHLAEALR